MQTLDAFKKQYVLRTLLFFITLILTIAFFPLFMGGVIVMGTFPALLLLSIGSLVLSAVILAGLVPLWLKLSRISDERSVLKKILEKGDDYCAQYQVINPLTKNTFPSKLELTLIDKHSISAFEYYCSNPNISAKAIAWFVCRLPKHPYTVIWLSKSEFDSLNNVKSIEPYTVYCCSDTSNKNVVQYKLLNPENKFISNSVQCYIKDSSELLNAIQAEPNWPIQSLALRGLLRALDNPDSDVTVLTILFLRALVNLPLERCSKVALVFAETVFKKLADETKNPLRSSKNFQKISDVLSTFDIFFLEQDKAAWRGFCQVLLSENPKECIAQDQGNIKELSMRTAIHVASEDSAPVIMLLCRINAINAEYKKKSEIERFPRVIRKKIILENFGIFSARNSLKIQDNPLVSETKNIFKTS